MKKCLNNVKHELGVHDAKYPYTELTEISAYWLRIMSRCRNELCRNISKNKFHQHTYPCIRSHRQVHLFQINWHFCLNVQLSSSSQVCRAMLT